MVIGVVRKITNKRERVLLVLKQTDTTEVAKKLTLSLDFTEANK